MDPKFNVIKFDYGIYIGACQRDGVSKEPPWLQAAARHGSVTLKIKKIRANIRPVLLRQGEPGTPQYSLHARAVIPSGAQKYPKTTKSG